METYKEQGALQFDSDSAGSCSVPAAVDPVRAVRSSRHWAGQRLRSEAGGSTWLLRDVGEVGLARSPLLDAHDSNWDSHSKGSTKADSGTTNLR